MDVISCARENLTNLPHERPRKPVAAARDSPLAAAAQPSPLLPTELTLQTAFSAQAIRFMRDFAGIANGTASRGLTPPPARITMNSRNRKAPRLRACNAFMSHTDLPRDTGLVERAGRRHGDEVTDRHGRSGRRFVVLDRDGTINAERDYISSPDQVELLPGTGGALRTLREMDLGLVVITNQSAIGRGYFDMGRLDEIHQRLRELLAEEAVELDGIYVCPHTAESRCDCRKPLPGLLRRAAGELGFSPQECFVVGDKPSDIELGRGVGAATVLVRTGYGRQTEAARTAVPDFIADDLVEAAALIGRELHSRHGSN
jgi:D-glycero-D-manno-heptose 1,7-bisphosphate phosphatase